LWTLDEADGAVTFRGQGIEDNCKIGSPGCAKRGITVGSYTTKISWQDQGGANQGVSLKLEDISSFSSEGPLRDDTAKPDIVAPGAMVVAAMSSGSNADGAYIVSSDMRVNAGTSMACPVISGLVALLLQKDRTLTPEKARELLYRSATVPGLPSGTFDRKWGRGLVDCSLLEQALLGGV
jgi:subtilisin family serine protease